MVKLAVVALLLSGCATTQGSVRQLPPKMTYQSAKSQDALAECLSDKLSHLGGPSVIQGEHRTTLSFGSGGITSLMVEISSSTVTVKSGYPYLPGFRNRVEACL
jgi:hypothetical protein